MQTPHPGPQLPRSASGVRVDPCCSGASTREKIRTAADCEWKCRVMKPIHGSNQAYATPRPWAPTSRMCIGGRPEPYLLWARVNKFSPLRGMRGAAKVRALAGVRLIPVPGDLTGGDVPSRLVYLRVRLLYAEGVAPFCRQNRARTEYLRRISYLAQTEVARPVSRILLLAVGARGGRGYLQ